MSNDSIIDIALVLCVCIVVYFVIRALREPERPTRPERSNAASMAEAEEGFVKAFAGIFGAIASVLFVLCCIGIAFAGLYGLVRLIHWMWYQ